jgi:uncharacterized pyridoxal phosphate-containing UPF0001 family protein
MTDHPSESSANPAVAALAEVRAAIDAACRDAQRDPASVTLVAV